jgi:rare lipoprotein A
MRKTITSIALVLFALTPAVVHAKQCTTASYYGSEYHGRRTANGETYNQWALTAAHPYLPFGTRLRVVNQNNGRSVNVRINDRGPFIGGRGIDLSTAAMQAINGGGGLASVCYRSI